jgi:precorrin-6B C5,15-methyltransferase / cobalt-precorrin-6B C5,C15-methyltransferase
VTIAVVGIGLEGADGLAVPIKKIVEQATVLGGSKRHLSYFPQHQGRKIELANLKTGIAEIASLMAENSSVVILASGDPLFFGLGRLLLANFDSEQIQFYPHLSSIQLGFSRLKIPWQDAELISVHGRSNEQLIKLLQQGKAKIALLTDGNNHPSAIARLYLALDLPLNYSFYICENLGDNHHQEKISCFTGKEIEKLSNLASDSFASLNVLILIRQSQTDSIALDKLPIIGLPDSSFFSFEDRPSLITKREIRLAILGELGLQPNQTVWDIGAGTGSVSIEIARLCPTSKIFAIEKTSMGSTLIAKNSHRFQLNNIQNINGKAPEILLDLPDPQRIFIGGSGGNLIAILDICQQKIVDRGILVMAFATVEHGYQALNWLSNNSWQYHLLQLQISRSTPINHLTRFTPLNPITIITAINYS